MTDSTFSHTGTQYSEPASDLSGTGPTLDVLAQARLQATQTGLAFAGSVHPNDAWQLVQSGDVSLVDVRTVEERKFVGYVPGSIHVPWATGTALTRNPRFVKELENKIKDKSKVVLLLCRSGKRSAVAAEAASLAGFGNMFNVSEGFEGDLNEVEQRGQLGGWRFHHLPWVQD